MQGLKINTYLFRDQKYQTTGTFTEKYVKFNQIMNINSGTNQSKFADRFFVIDIGRNS